MSFTSQNMTILQSHRQTQVAIDMRRQITAEAVAGIWTAEEARAKIMALAGDDHPPPPVTIGIFDKVLVGISTEQDRSTQRGRVKMVLLRPFDSSLL